MTARSSITTPIYYVNGAPHIGHAYTSVVADAIARSWKMRGQEVYFQTGTDEHGLKIERAAEAQGMSPERFTQRMSEVFRNLVANLGLSPDQFIRTSYQSHMDEVQGWWRKCRDAGDLYKGSYRGLYCVGCEGYKTEKDLLPGNLCSIHHRPVETLETESWMFRLSNYRDRLLKLYEDHPEFILPKERRAEVISQVRDNLDDLSVSRPNVKWGIPVPEDPEHTIYVWFDALLNYVTGSGDRWPVDLHLVGKDILRFHAVYWPAMLMSLGLPLPQAVFAHGFLLAGDRKIGKTQEDDRPVSRGTTDPFLLVKHLGASTLRYYLLREVSLGQDGTFSIPDLLHRGKTELGFVIGNLLHRTVPFVTKYFQGVIPDPGLISHEDDLVLESIRGKADRAKAAWRDLDPHRAIHYTLEIARAANVFFDAEAPWTLAKTGGEDRLATVVGLVFASLRTVALLLWPVAPAFADTLLQRLGLPKVVPQVGTDLWGESLVGLLPHGTEIVAGDPIYPRRTPETENHILRDLGVLTTDGGNNSR